MLAYEGKVVGKKLLYVVAKQGVIEVKEDSFYHWGGRFLRLDYGLVALFIE